VKYLLPAGTALILGIGVCLHRAPGIPCTQPPKEESCRSVPWTPTPEPQEHHRAESLGGEAPAQTGLGKAVRVQGTILPAKVPVPSGSKILLVVKGPLSLTEDQNTVVEGLLRRREDEIKELHDGFRRAGFIDLRQYEWQVGLLKTEWFRRIDAVLDTNQHDRFVVLVEKGLFNEGLAFNVDPGMTILE